MNADECRCLRCGEKFRDVLAFAAHRPMGRVVRTSVCKFPRDVLYLVASEYVLRPDARAAIQAAEDAPASAFKTTSKRALARLPKKRPSVFAGSRRLGAPKAAIEARP
jgi:hypothetical protein